MRILAILSRPSMILLSFFAMVIIGASFGFFQRFVGGDLLDMSMNGQDAIVRLSEMSIAQKRSHMWITLLVDSLYPIAYGSFFAGATVKLAGGTKGWFALPALITVVADGCENFVQFLALNGHESLLMAKSLFTPIKFSAFTLTSLLLLFLFLLALYRKQRRKADFENG